MDTTQTHTSNGNGAVLVEPVSALAPDWRERATQAALGAGIHYGEGEYEMLRWIHRSHPNAASLVMQADRDQLLGFLRRRAAPVRQLVAATRHTCDYGPPMHCTGWYSAVWEGRPIEIAFAPATYEKSCEVCIGEDFDSLKRLSDAIEQEAIRPIGRCLRFTSSWEKATDLDAELGKVTWDDIVLPKQTSEQIQESVAAFFAHRDIYARLGFAWRRGLLLVGPPGTGKTMICKAVASSQPDLPFLYVRNIRDKNCGTARDAMTAIFTRARKLAPCLLVFEDIDGMVGDDRRTVFLNELDGFKSNDGLFIIASSNHPSKIDEALLKRPSRFDRVFHIGLPDVAERREFCVRVLSRGELAEALDPALDIEALADAVAQASDGFTPAYLKEGLVSAALARAQSGHCALDSAFGEEVLTQVRELGEYIRRAKNPDAWSQMRSGRDTVGFRS